MFTEEGWTMAWDAGRRWWSWSSTVRSVAVGDASFQAAAEGLSKHTLSLNFSFQCLCVLHNNRLLLIHAVSKYIVKDIKIRSLSAFSCSTRLSRQTLSILFCNLFMTFEMHFVYLRTHMKWRNVTKSVSATAVLSPISVNIVWMYYSCDVNRRVFFTFCRQFGIFQKTIQTILLFSWD